MIADLAFIVAAYVLWRLLTDGIPMEKRSEDVFNAYRVLTVLAVFVVVGLTYDMWLVNGQLWDVQQNGLAQ